MLPNFNLKKIWTDGVRGQELKLIRDKGSQQTSVSFMRDMATLGMKQIFCSYDNPKGNADTGRVMRTIKEELLWLNEFSSFEEAKASVAKWVEEDYNRLYVHSTLGYLSPDEISELWAQQEVQEVGVCIFLNMDRLEIVDCRASGEAVFLRSSTSIPERPKKCLDFLGSLQENKQSFWDIGKISSNFIIIATK